MNYEKIALATQEFDGFIKNNSALKSIILDEPVAYDGEQNDETSQSIQEFLDSPLGDKKELYTKKIIAAATLIGKERGILTNLPNSAAAIAALVDEGMTRVKVNYLVGNGLLDVEKAIEHVIDHAESRTVAFVDKVFESGIISNMATEGLVSLVYAIPEIGPVIGPIAENYKPIIKNVIAKVEVPVRNAIKKGIHVIAETSKKVVHKAKEKLQVIANVLADKCMSWLE